MARAQNSGPQSMGPRAPSKGQEREGKARGKQCLSPEKAQMPLQIFGACQKQVPWRSGAFRGCSCPTFLGSDCRITILSFEGPTFLHVMSCCVISSDNPDISTTRQAFRGDDIWLLCRKCPTFFKTSDILYYENILVPT